MYWKAAAKKQDIPSSVRMVNQMALYSRMHFLVLLAGKSTVRYLLGGLMIIAAPHPYMQFTGK